MAHLILLASTTHHIWLQTLEPDISKGLRSTCSNHPSPKHPLSGSGSLPPYEPSTPLGPHLIDNSLLTKTFPSLPLLEGSIFPRASPSPPPQRFFPLPTPLLSAPLLGKCHHRVAYFFYFYYESHTGVPGSASHPTGPLPMKRDASPLWFGHFSLTSFSVGLGMLRLNSSPWH